MTEPALATPAPGTTPAIWGTVREAWGLLRAHPRPLILPFALVFGPFMVLNPVAIAWAYLTRFDDLEYSQSVLFSPPEGEQLALSLILAALGLPFLMVATAATALATHAVVKGEPLRLSEALDPPFTRLFGLVGVFVIAGMLPALITGTLFAAPIGIYALLRLGLAVPAFIIESKSASQAVGRSWTLQRGNLLRFAAILVTFASTAMIAVLIASIPLSIPLALIDTDSRERLIVADAIASVIGGLVILPAFAGSSVVITLFYLKVRGADQ